MDHHPASAAGSFVTADPAEPRPSPSQMRAALQHLRRAERAAGPPGWLRAAPCGTARIAVAGGGPDAVGIALGLLATGAEVTLIEAEAEEVTRALHAVDAHVEAALARGRIAPDAARAHRARFAATTDPGRAAGADLGIEAAPEAPAAKRAALALLEAALPAQAVLASALAFLGPEEVGAGLRDPSRLVGLHLPPALRGPGLAEILPGPASADRALATGFALAARLGRLPVLAGRGAGPGAEPGAGPGAGSGGPLAARLLNRLNEAAETVFMDGSTPWEVDEAMVAFGFARGPFEAQDLSGIDLAHAARRHALAREPGRRRIPLAGRMLELGKLGRRTGAGWYRYPGGGGKVEDPIVADLALEESHFERRLRTDYGPAEIRHRLIRALLEEAVAILQEGAAASAADIDLLSVHGIGFPRWRGGLMHHAARLGAPPP